MRHDKEYWRQYRQTPMGRAANLLGGYRRKDKKYNRGEGDLTAEWIVENIFTKPCAHCGETDWTKIGCNRLDNTKPHTKDNVEPCCKECNDKLAGVYHMETQGKEVYQYTLDGKLIRAWVSANEAGRNGYNYGNICACCRGERNTCGGFRWSYN